MYISLSLSLSIYKVRMSRAGSLARFYSVEGSGCTVESLALGWVGLGYQCLEFGARLLEMKAIVFSGLRDRERERERERDDLSGPCFSGVKLF